MDFFSSGKVTIPALPRTGRKAITNYTAPKKLRLFKQYLLKVLG